MYRNSFNCYLNNSKQLMQFMNIFMLVFIGYGTNTVFAALNYNPTYILVTQIGKHILTIH